MLMNAINVRSGLWREYIRINASTRLEFKFHRYNLDFKKKSQLSLTNTKVSLGMCTSTTRNHFCVKHAPLLYAKIRMNSEYKICLYLFALWIDSNWFTCNLKKIFYWSALALCETIGWCQKLALKIKNIFLFYQTFVLNLNTY